MKKTLILVSIFTLVTISISAQKATPEAGRFYNPVIRGDVADPSVIRFKGRYYATGTSSEWAPHYPVFESKDLVNWTQTGHVFNKKPAWTVNSFWAPEFFVNPNSGRVFCYYTARQADSNISYIGVASAKSPHHEFTDHGPLVEWGTEAIDAFVWDDSGQLYISWKAYGLDDRPIEILGSRLSADGLRLEGEPFTMLRDDRRIGMEGQYHFERDGWWYIVYAARGCCGPRSDYEVWVARSRSVEGPYETYEGNPILWAGAGDFKSCGHGTGVETPDGRIFYLCHAYRPEGGFHLGRQPILQEMRVNDAGWVEFAGGRTALVEQQAPFAGTKQKPLADFVDMFDGRTLRPDWTWNYPWSDVSATIKKGNLVLTGTPVERNGYGSALCLRAPATDYSYETELAGESAAIQGLTMYGDANNLVIFGTQGSRLFVKVVDDGKETTLWETTLDPAPKTRGASFPRPANTLLKAGVKNGCVLTFSYSVSDGPGGPIMIPIRIEPLDRSKLVRWDRVARPGLIHIGPAHLPVEFEWFRMGF